MVEIWKDPPFEKNQNGPGRDRTDRTYNKNVRQQKEAVDEIWRKSIETNWEQKTLQLDDLHYFSKAENEDERFKSQQISESDETEDTRKVNSQRKFIVAEENTEQKAILRNRSDEKRSKEVRENDESEMWVHRISLCTKNSVFNTRKFDCRRCERLVFP